MSKYNVTFVSVYTHTHESTNKVINISITNASIAIKK